jgi:hypothetical protein
MSGLSGGNESLLTESPGVVTQKFGSISWNRPHPARASPGQRHPLMACNLPSSLAFTPVMFGLFTRLSTKTTNQNIKLADASQELDINPPYPGNRELLRPRTLTGTTILSVPQHWHQSRHDGCIDKARLSPL